MLTRRLATTIPGPIRPVVRRAVVRARYVGLRETDALLVSYPKSGSTWLRFLLVHALTGHETDFDDVRRSFPPLGRHRGAPALLAGRGRAVRTHEPLGSFRGPADLPVVYLARDARPVALAYLRHLGRVLGRPVDPEVFVADFLAGTVDSYGPWHDHVAGVRSFAAARSGPTLIVRFEDLQHDTAAVVREVLAFLGCPPVVDVDDVVAANSAARMRAKEATSEHLRQESRDASSFVTAGDRPSWVESVPAEAREQFEAVVGPSLQALGYPLELGTAS